MSEPLYIAIDLGAGSGRVFLSGVEPGVLRLEEIRRFRYPASTVDGHLRWDLGHIFDEIKTSLRAAAKRASQLGRRIQSVGVNSWGVDYGLIDPQGRLIADPVCYRDDRTEGVMAQVFARVPRAELFARTGIQMMRFNTLFQLYAQHRESPIPTDARLLLMPDLINFFLTGRAVSEHSNATTTQMVNAESGGWDTELLERLGLPVGILPEIVAAGTKLGPIKPELADELGLDGVEVIAPATHDTGSALVGTPLDGGWAYISSGTWSLVGIERDRPLINADAERFNLTNEGGAFGTFRLLKNVMGLWILERCRTEWAAGGIEFDYAKLLQAVAAREDFPGFIFPDDPRFFSPVSMLETVAEQLRETGQTVGGDPVTLTKIILDSLALRYASVLRVIEGLAKTKIRGVHIVGGGSQNSYLNQMTANITGLTVRTGPVEATVTGNMLVQAITAGRFASLAEGRRYVAANIDLGRYLPRESPTLVDAAACYAEIEARYLN
jgi:rhamnulokinase